MEYIPHAMLITGAVIMGYAASKLEWRELALLWLGLFIGITGSNLMAAKLYYKEQCGIEQNINTKEEYEK